MTDSVSSTNCSKPSACESDGRTSQLSPDLGSVAVLLTLSAARMCSGIMVFLESFSVISFASEEIAITNSAVAVS